MNTFVPPGSGAAPPGGIEAYVPLRQTPNGNMMLLAPPRAQLMQPPQIDGMPVMPGFPAGFLNGAMPTAGGGGATSPVAPFNPLPLGDQMAERARRQVYPGPPALGGLLLPIPLGPRAVMAETGRPW